MGAPSLPAKSRLAPVENHADLSSRPDLSAPCVPGAPPDSRGLGVAPGPPAGTPR